MYERSEVEQEAIDAFLGQHFTGAASKVSSDEAKVVDGILQFVSDEFSGMKYIVGLAIDFVLLAQGLAENDAEANKFRPSLDRDGLFDRYEFVESRGKRRANTLTLRHAGKAIGIRKFEESLVDLFHDQLNRTAYPSAYVYNTGQWAKYQESLLVPAFKMSQSGKRLACDKLIDLALQRLPVNRFFGRDVPRVRVFPSILQSYPRSAEGENGGLVFQAIAYAYFKADRPHLSLVVDKVRTGSARQRRFGDIDGYYGVDLELSVEVKDMHIDASNVTREIGTFSKKASANKIRGIVFAYSVDGQVRSQLEGDNVFSLTMHELAGQVDLWDWEKQDAAVQGMLHYIAHVEQDADATTRLLEFISSVDPGHDSLAYFQPAD
jgi:hypothetical protein